MTPGNKGFSFFPRVAPSPIHFTAVVAPLRKRARSCQGRKVRKNERGKAKVCPPRTRFRVRFEPPRLYRVIIRGTNREP